MIFEFYWSWHEDYCPYLFEHTDKTEEEFNSDCIRAMTECFDKYMQEHDDWWASISDWVEYACTKLQDYGYTRVKPIRFGLFGGYIVSKEDKEEESLSCFSKQIDIMTKYNDEFDKEQYKDLYEEHPELVEDRLRAVKGKENGT